MTMGGREYVDFSVVDQRHAEIHARLENWGKWSRGRGGVAMAGSPMFRLYRTPHHWRHTIEPSVQVVDSADAQAMQSAVCSLPTKHRLALSWYYISPWTNPAKAARTVGESMQGLRVLLGHGRTMLMHLCYRDA
jgi:hypothetical protein